MPHLVAHHHQDLVVLHGLERRIPEHDALRAAEPAHVGVDLLRAPAHVHLEHVPRRHARAVGERQDLRAQPLVAQRLELVEERIEHQRLQDREEGDERGRPQAQPPPPAARAGAQHAPAQPHDREHAERDHRQDQRLERVPEPAAQRLRREPVLVLERVLLVPGERQAQHRHGRHEQGEVDQHPDVEPVPERVRDVAEARREPGEEQQQQQERPDQRSDEPQHDARVLVGAVDRRVPRARLGEVVARRRGRCGRGAVRGRAVGGRRARQQALLRRPQRVRRLRVRGHHHGRAGHGCERRDVQQRHDQRGGERAAKVHDGLLA